MALGRRFNIIRLSLQMTVGGAASQRKIFSHGSIYGDLICKGMRDQCYCYLVLYRGMNLQMKVDTILGLGFSWFFPLLNCDVLPLT